MVSAVGLRMLSFAGFSAAGLSLPFATMVALGLLVVPPPGLEGDTTHRIGESPERQVPECIGSEKNLYQKFLIWY